jgi:hypothetical protein
MWSYRTISSARYVFNYAWKYQKSIKLQPRCHADLMAWQVDLLRTVLPDAQVFIELDPGAGGRGPGHEEILDQVIGDRPILIFGLGDVFLDLRAGLQAIMGICYQSVEIRFIAIGGEESGLN